MQSQTLRDAPEPPKRISLPVLLTYLTPRERERLEGDYAALESLRRLRGYRTDPASYYLEHLGRGLITTDQQRICRSVIEHRRTAVPAGHATGKTDLCAGLANWWYDCWPEHICYITAPTWPQVLGLTFKQVVRFRAGRGLSGDILDSGIVRDEDRKRRGAHYIRALNAERGEGFQGEHAAPMLLILEEAQGVPHYIWDALEGLLTHPDSRAIAIGNPTDEASDFGAACGSVAWNTVEVSSLDHPNIAAELAGDPPPVPDAVRLLWVQEMISRECEEVPGPDGQAFEFAGKWYRSSAYFDGRARGKFTASAGNRVIPLAWARACQGITLRHEDGALYEPRGEIIAGWDVSGGGEAEHAVFVRRGAQVLHWESWHGSVEAGVERAIGIAEAQGAQVMHYDVSGPGDAVAGILTKRQAPTPVRINPVNGGEHAPKDVILSDGRRADEQYANLRAYLWAGILAERCRRTWEHAANGREYRTDELLSIPNDDLLLKQLAAPMREEQLGGRTLIESKLRMAARGVASPDRADALALTFAPAPPLMMPTGLEVVERLPAWM